MKLTPYNQTVNALRILCTGVYRHLKPIRACLEHDRLKIVVACREAILMIAALAQHKAFHASATVKDDLGNLPRVRLAIVSVTY